MRWATETMRRATEPQRHGIGRVAVRLFAALAIAVVLVSAPLAAQAPQPASKPQDEFVPVSQLPAQDQLPAAPLLVTAYGFVWLVVFGYVVSVSRRLSNVQRDIQRLESDIKRGTRA